MGILAMVLFSSQPSNGDPSKYPEFAQQALPANVTPVFISVDELLPTAREYGHHHHAIDGLIAGMAVMAVSLLLFIS